MKEKKYFHLVSSVLYYINEHYINTSLSRCRETWARGMSSTGGGGGVVGNPWPV
jgi:hypothetical protein